MNHHSHDNILHHFNSLWLGLGYNRDHFKQQVVGDWGDANEQDVESATFYT